MEDRGATVEQRLDVNEFPGPVRFLEDAPAEPVLIRPEGLGTMGLGSVLRSGESQHPGPLGRSRSFLQADQDLAQLDSTIRRDHDELTTLQWGGVIL
jgi:hypothetical protein